MYSIQEWLKYKYHKNALLGCFRIKPDFKEAPLYRINVVTICQDTEPKDNNVLPKFVLLVGFSSAACRIGILGSWTGLLKGRGFCKTQLVDNTFWNWALRLFSIQQACCRHSYAAQECDRGVNTDRFSCFWQKPLANMLLYWQNFPFAGKTGPLRDATPQMILHSGRKCIFASESCICPVFAMLCQCL